jgi:phospholipid transport system substrate-binding protein
MLRRTFMLVCALAALFAARAPGARADDAADAQAFINDLAKQAVANVTASGISDQERADRFRKLFVGAFDIQEIGRSMVSRYAWKQATPEQQQQFLKLFEDVTVLTWSRRFKEYDGQTLEATQATAEADGVWLIDSQFNQPQGEPLPVQWKVHKTSDGWRIVDIIVASSSMVLTQRQDYASVLQNGGGLAGLLDTMQKKVAQLQSGS